MSLLNGMRLDIVLTMKGNHGPWSNLGSSPDVASVVFLAEEPPSFLFP